MLVLSRHKNEGIRIGDNVRIIVVDIRGDKVRLGIEAPSKLAVHRDEIYAAILEQNGIVVSTAKLRDDEVDLEEMADRCSDPQE